MSTVILDTITGKSTATTITIGSTPVVSASANSMTIRGEGSNQTSIQQGLAKAFLSYKATDTVSIYNSNNIASVTDHGTGDQSPNYTNNFSSGTSYACSAFGQEDSGGGGRIMCGKGTPGVGDRRVNTVNTSNTSVDLLYFNIVYHGDLT
jgi:hypothetical protein